MEYVYVSCLVLTLFGNLVLSEFEVLPVTTWFDGKLTCETMGFKMAVIDSPDVTSELFSYIGTLSTTINEFWFGLYWNSSTRQFYWTNNTPLGTYHPWYLYQDIKEPNCMTNQCYCVHDKCGQNCVRVVKDGGRLVWMTTQCNTKLAVICSTEESSTLPLPTNSTVPLPTTTVPTRITTSASMNTSSSALNQLSKTTLPGSTNDMTFWPSTGTKTDQNNYNTDTNLNESKSSETNVSQPVCPQTFLRSGCECKLIKSANISSHKYDYIYAIDKKKTGAYMRKLHSAHDERLSAKVIGCTGAVILTASFSVIICLDISLFCRTKKEGRRRVTRK